MSTRDDILHRLFAKTTKGIKLGLERMQKAVSALGNPHNAYRSVHVAGTNGKGSVCAYIESALRRGGMRTGLFTSPHIVRFEERFVIDGTAVAESEWLDVYRDVEDVAEKLDLTFFEISTLVAFELFRRRKVEWGVFEVGLGGRLDATNVLNPAACAVTALGMDHCEYLGTTIESIAREKLAIAKSGVPMVLMQPGSESVESVARDVCARKGAELCVARSSDIHDIERTGRGTTFVYDGQRFEIPLRGVYQPLNALCALKVLEKLGCSSDESMREGLRRAVLPGRFQVERVEGTAVVLDVGHNEQAAASFAETFESAFPAGRACIVAGIMADKDTKGMLAQYCRFAGTLVLTQSATARACPAPVLATHVPEGYSGRVRVIARVGQAVRFALENSPGIVCVVGSFYTVGEAMQELGIDVCSSTRAPASI